jgi:lipopolysaccharide transport system permease protein
MSVYTLTGLLNAHRAVILGHVPVDYAGLAISAVITLVIFISGILYLRRTEKYFADLV